MTSSIQASSWVAAIAVATAIWANPALAARSSFDGAWSVVVITDAGTCSPSYRYGVQISDGRVFHPSG